MSEEKTQIVMKCPCCHDEMSLFFDPDTMPEGTVVIDNACPDCGTGGFPIAAYFDSNGDEIFEQVPTGDVSNG